MTSVDKRLELAYKSSLVGANLERADLRGLDLRGINLTSANLRGADLSQANLSQATLIRTDLSRANIQRANFTDADMTGVDMAYGFFLGARFGPPLCKTDQMRNVDKAVFHWYWDPRGGVPSYDPKEGYVDLWHSVLGGISIQENASTRPK